LESIIWAVAKTDPDALEFKRALRKHILDVLRSGVKRSLMCDVLGVTKQAISSYTKGRTTPKPHIIEKLLRKWPTDLPYRNAAFRAGAFGDSSPKLKSIPFQRDLFESLNSIRKENMRVEVSEESASEVELKFFIRIAR
jgi:transcriptional regulator with XRE-family HTH domain